MSKSKPKLLHFIEQSNSELVDYTGKHFTKYYEWNGGMYAFSVAPDLYPDVDGLDFTGSMSVLAQTPNGTQYFQLIHDGNRWKPVGNPRVAAEVIALISNAIDGENE